MPRESIRRERSRDDNAAVGLAPSAPGPAWSSDPPLVKAALQYAALGIRVFPVHPRGKRPLAGLKWKDAATTDLDEIRAMWARTPAANIGVVCNGVFVLDADSPQAEEMLIRLALPRSATVRTARGVHVYFWGEVASAKLGSDLEVKGRGGYVVGAGSLHPSGHRYRWELPPSEVPIARAPDELLKRIGERRRFAGRARPPIGSRIAEGKRNASLTRLAGGMRRAGCSQGEIEAALVCANGDRCEPPLDASEVPRIAASVARYPEGPPWVVDPLAFTAGLNPSERSVLLSLCAHAQDDGRCWPGVRLIAEQSGLHRSSVQSVTERLETLGRIAVTRSRSGNRYRVLDRQTLRETGSSVRVKRTAETSRVALARVA